MNILLAGLDRSSGGELALSLRRRGCEVVETTIGPALDETLGLNGLDVTLLPLELPATDALEVLGRIRRLSPSVPVVILARDSASDRALQAVRLGARACEVWPADPEQVAAAILSFLPHPFLRVETHGHQALWSEVTRPLYRMIERAAPSRATVLITGETGTGKEVAARTLHELSPRRAKPFVSINCAALSSGLLESELFGHEKGAFTNAHFTRKGRFEEAEGGTLFLDEVSEMESGLQAKLLRVLQGGTFERVGSNRTLRPDVRVIATSNRDLKKESEAGRFRQDLYFRLNVVHLHMPCLRERMGEIPMFLDYFSRLHRVRLTSEARMVLIRYAWPGNVRQVENLIQRWAVIGGDELLSLAQLPREVREECRLSEPGDSDLVEPATLAETLAQVERRTILRVLERSGNNQVRAAKALGISRTTLRNKLRELGALPSLEAAGDLE